MNPMTTLRTMIPAGRRARFLARRLPAANAPAHPALPAPWEMDRHQRALEALVRDGRIAGEVLDVASGTGENALFVAAAGHAVVGMDRSERLVNRARQKARARRLAADFQVGGPSSLRAGGAARFDTVLDLGLLHLLRPSARRRWMETVRHVLRPGGAFHLLVFSEGAPAWVGPSCLKRSEVLAALGRGWHVEALAEAPFELRQGRVPGWLLSARRQ